MSPNKDFAKRGVSENQILKSQSQLNINKEKVIAMQRPFNYYNIIL